MRRLLLALISFSLAAVVALPVPASALPSNVQGSPGGAGELVVTWDQSGDGTVVDYLIEIDQGGGALDSAVVAVAGPLTTTFTGLGNGQTYTITVTARDAGSATVGTSTGSGTTIALPSITSVTASASGTSAINVSWVANAGGGTNTYAVAISPDDAADQAGVTGTTTSFGGLNPNVEYTITVTPTNEAGAGSGGSDSATTDTGTAVVSSVTATPSGSNSINVSWVADAGGGTNTYAVAISPDDAADQSGVTGTTTSFSGLNPGVTYTITVTPTNGAGAGTPGSDTATTGFGTAVVSSVTATGGAGVVDVSWVADAGGGTNTYAVAISPADAAAQAGLTGTTTSFSGLNPGVTYTITVTPTNEAGAGTAGSDTATTIALPSVSAVSATANGSTGVNVTWTGAGGGGTNTYAVSISPADDTAKTGLSGTSTSFSGLTPGVTYTVTVTPTNEAGTGPSGSDMATTNAVAASVPRNVASALGGAFGNFVTVSWEAPADDGGSAITGYIVTLSNGVTATVGGAARSTTFETLNAGTTVTAQVRAVNAAGNGPNSGASNSVTTSNVPANVTNLSAAWAGESNINAINVSWTASANDGGDGVTLTGYVVTVTPALENSIPVVDPGETSVVIGGLEQGTSYTITVQAQNQRGNSSGVSSSSVLVPSTPGTVTDLVVSQSPPFSSSIVLTWQLPEQDGGSPITGYSIVVDDREPLIVGPEVTTASFSDLPIGDHNVTVRAITAAGLGATVTSPNFEVKGFPPFDSEEAFVTQLYADFLRRTPDASGLAFWTDRVADDGSNVQVIIEAFMRSPEFAPRRAVARMYFAYLNRQPDVSGFDFWTQQISTGQAVIEDVSQSFALSPEFLNATRIEDPADSGQFRPLTDGEFIVYVYNAVLNRRPDQGGFEFWLDRLNSGLNRGTLMTLFSESPENIDRSRSAVDVTVTYFGLLRRAPETTCNTNQDPDCISGFEFWTRRVSEGNTGLVELIRQFYFSPEYADRVNR